MAWGSNRTQVPIRKQGILPAAACLKMVTLETESSSASSSAVKARCTRSICSAKPIVLVLIIVLAATGNIAAAQFHVA